jgi:chromosome segregation ATPase
MDVQTQVMNLLDDIEPTREQLSFQINTLQREVERLQGNFERTRARSNELELRISNVRGHIMDMYSINGELDDDIHEIARMLDIELTKTISGTMTIEVEFTAEVPLNYDKDDLDLSYSIDSHSYEVDNFDWTEISADWTVDEN